MGTLKIQLECSKVNDTTLSANIFVGSHLGCETDSVLVLFWPLSNVGIQNFGIWGMYDLAKAYRSIKNPLPIAESRTGKPAMGTLKIQLNCSTVHDTMLSANIFVGSHLGCETDSIFMCFCRSHKYFKDAKAMQINRFLKINKFDMSNSITRQNNRDLNPGILLLWSKFGDPSLKG